MLAYNMPAQPIGGVKSKGEKCYNTVVNLYGEGRGERLIVNGEYP